MGEGGRIYSEKGEIDALLRHKDPVGSRTKTYGVNVGKDGSLSIPPELAKELGLAPDVQLDVVRDHGRVEILPNIHSLKRLYIEPTSRCNLSCRTCIRNTWDEPTGDMDETIFDRLVSQIARFPHLETVMFGSFGEPTAHPRILDMIRAVKALGLRAEMTTNATLLGEALIDGLLRERLDTLWISLDGTTEESFETIREGASFPLVLENVERLGRRNGRDGHRIDIGIAFVVMKTNLHDVKHLDRLARSVGARRILEIGRAHV